MGPERSAAKVSGLSQADQKEGARTFVKGFVQEPGASRKLNRLPPVFEESLAHIVSTLTLKNHPAQSGTKAET